MMKRLLISLLAILILGTAYLTYRQYPFRLDYGAIKDDVYRNGYFHLSLPVRGWYPADMEMTKWREEAAKGDPSSSGKAPVRPPAWTRPSIHLVTLYDQGWTAPGEFNSSFFVFAELKTLRPKVRNADEYLKAVVADMMVDHPEVRVPEPPAYVRVDGRQGARLRVEITQGGKVWRQEYISFMSRKYYLSCVFTWETQEQRLRMQSLLDSLKFRL